jgi:hypothetical protein
MELLPCSSAGCKQENSSVEILDMCLAILVVSNAVRCWLCAKTLRVVGYLALLKCGKDVLDFGRVVVLRSAASFREGCRWLNDGAKSFTRREAGLYFMTDRHPSGRRLSEEASAMSDVKIQARATLACDVMGVAPPQPQIAAGSGVMLPCLGCTIEATFFVSTLDAHTSSQITLHTIHYHVITLKIIPAASAHRKGFITRFTTSCARRPAVRSILQ